MLRHRTIMIPVSMILLGCAVWAQEPAAVPPVVTAAAVTPAAVTANDSTASTQPATEEPEAAAPATPEDKRIFGVLPNYRTVEGSAPFTTLTARQKLWIATKDTIDGPSYALAAMFSGLDQLADQNPSFGQGMKGYAKRYGASIADQDLGNYMTEGFMPVLLHEDPRYFRRGYGRFLSRTFHAASGVIVAKTDSGAPIFNFSEFLGNGVTASVGNAYYTDGVGFRPTMERMFTQIGTDAFSNVLKEFWPDFKRKVLKKGIN